MKKWPILFLLLLLLPCLVQGATTATVSTCGVGATCVGTTVTTILSYANPSGSPAGAQYIYYTGSTITITGGSGTSGSPYSWTLADQNSDTVWSGSTSSQSSPVTPLGEIDCSASAANSVCVYNAPQEYPSTQAITITITDGSTSATVTVKFSYLDNLNEYWTHRGRVISACLVAGCSSTSGTISTITESSATATLTFTGSSPFAVGQYFWIFGNSAYNGGYYKVSTVAGSVITFPAFAAGLGSSSGGTAVSYPSGPLNNIPWGIYQFATSPVTWQSLQINFVDINTNGTNLNPPIEGSIISFIASAQTSGINMILPATAGSQINRPSMTYDGQWIFFKSNAQFPSTSENIFYYAQKTNGSSLQRLGTNTCLPSAYLFTVDKNNPEWLLTADTTFIDVCNLSTAQTLTHVATHGIGGGAGSGSPSPFSYPGGAADNLFAVKTLNQNLNGGPGADVPTTMPITNTSLTSNVASYTYGTVNGKGPYVGLYVTVTGTTNGSGIFNVTNTSCGGGPCAIQTVSGGVFTINLTNANVTSATDTGTASILGCFPIQSACAATEQAWNMTPCYPVTVNGAPTSTTCATLDGTFNSFLNIIPTGANYGYDEAGNGHGSYIGNGGYAHVTATSLTSNVATYTYSLSTGSQPLVGAFATITGTTNGSGVFNVTYQPILSVTGTTFTIAITNANVSSASESGTGCGVGTGSCAQWGAPNGEAGFHDIWFIPRTNTFAWLYGPGGSVGEGMFFTGPDNATNSTTTFLSPNAVANVAYWGHPGFPASNPYLVTYGGRPNCNVGGSSTTPVPTCKNPADGNVIFDLRSSAYLWYNTSVAVGHSAWDGYYIGYFGHDSAPGSTNALDTVNSCANETLSETNENASVLSGTGDVRNILQVFGCRPVGSNYPQSYDSGPSQSADATKMTYTMTISGQLSGNFLGWIFNTHKGLPPINVNLGSSSSALIQWFAAPLNRETWNYWIYKQPSCTGTWTRLASVAAVYLQATAYTYTDSALSSGTNACYGVTSQEWYGDESDHLSNVIKIANASGTFTKTVEQGEGTVGFAPAGVSDVTGLSVTQEPLCYTACQSSGVPHAPTVSATTGSLTGTYYWEVVDCKFLDYPENNNPNCTLPSAATSIALSAQNAVVTGPNSGEMVGQDAIQVYASTASGGPFYLQTPASCSSAGTVAVATIMLNNGILGSGSQITCTFSTYTTATQNPPTSATVFGGFKLAWTDAGGAGDRYDQLYYSENSAVPLSGANGCNGVAVGLSFTDYTGNQVLCTKERSAQEFLIATPAVGTQAFYDGLVNQGVSAANIHYAIVVKRMDNSRSAGVCMTGAGVSEACN